MFCWQRQRYFNYLLKKKGKQFWQNELEKFNKFDGENLFQQFEIFKNPKFLTKPFKFIDKNKKIDNYFDFFQRYRKKKILMKDWKHEIKLIMKK